LITYLSFNTKANVNLITVHLIFGQFIASIPDLDREDVADDELEVVAVALDPFARVGPVSIGANFGAKNSDKRPPAVHGLLVAAAVERRNTWDRCYDFLNFFAEKFSD
jgi:hypothetical protein